MALKWSPTTSATVTEPSILLSRSIVIAVIVNELLIEMSRAGLNCGVILGLFGELE